MTATATRLATGLLALASLIRPTGYAQDKDGKTDPAGLSGRYQLVTGKKNGMPISDEVKQGQYTITAEAITIEGGDVKFVIGYTLDTRAHPTQIDLKILEGPEGTKGGLAYGIVELKGETLRLAYSLDKDKRPKTFDGQEGFYFELKKVKSR